MKHSLLVKYILPFIQWYVLMIISAIGIDYILHRFQLMYIGRYFGFWGTLFILFSFVYSLRKRKIIESGAPKRLLNLHEYMAWIGSVILLVHAGIHFNALLPWLAVQMLLIVVASGLVGKFLLIKATETLNLRRNDLIHSGMRQEDVDRKLFSDSITVDLMKKWRSVHLPITLLLAILAILHIISIVMFGK
jgi:hypothetical protein